MTKKQDFLRDQQSRDKHPEKQQVGRRADAAERSAPDASADAQQPQSGKVSNDHNKAGETSPTQTNQPRRTPKSRHDRQTIGSGPHNQVTARKGGAGAGRGPRGSG